MQRLPRDTNELDQVVAELAKNHNLSGVCLHFFWNDLEKVSGKPDFSMVDKTVAEFRRLGMKYELGFGAGARTPRFVYDEGAKAISTQVPNPHRANYGETIEIPVPWDPIYQREFSRMIAAAGRTLRSRPLMCWCRPDLRQCHERGNAPYQDSLGSCEMAGNGRLRRQAARCLQEVYRRMGQSISTTGDIACTLLRCWTCRRLSANALSIMD